MIIPLGLVEAPRRRVPWVSLFIGLTCLTVHLIDDYRNDQRSEKLELSQAFRDYWKAHPYLNLPPEAASHLSPEEIDAVQESAKSYWADGKVPPDAQAKKEYVELQRLLAQSSEDPWHAEWGLTPSQGLLQPGWITSMFLHADWGHLVGNMIFFVLVGPVLEDLLTPFVFLGFYLVGGIIAALAHVVVMPSSVNPLIGASGAIAASMGLFTIRFWSSHLRLLWIRGLVPRVVEWPTWVWSGLWVGGQILMLILAGPAAGGVAVMAHLGGFAFGVAIAFGLRATGWGERLETSRPPIEDASRSPQETADPLERAEAYLKANDAMMAFDSYREALKRDPLNLPAQWGLARCLFLMGDPDEGSRVFDAVLARWIAAGNTAIVQHAINLVGRDLDPHKLRPAHAAVVAKALEEIDPQKARVAWAISVRDSAAFAMP